MQQESFFLVTHTLLFTVHAAMCNLYTREVFWERELSYLVFCSFYMCVCACYYVLVINKILLKRQCMLYMDKRLQQ